MSNLIAPPFWICPNCQAQDYDQYRNTCGEWRRCKGCGYIQNVKEADHE